MSAVDFAGAWDTNYGRLELQVKLSRVVGNYGDVGGYVEGTVSGNCLQGTWRQRAGSGNGDTWGTFSIELNDDATAFTGTWQYTDELAPDGGAWYGNRWWDPTEYEEPSLPV